MARRINCIAISTFFELNHDNITHIDIDESILQQDVSSNIMCVRNDDIWSEVLQTYCVTEKDAEDYLSNH